MWACCFLFVLCKKSPTGEEKQVSWAALYAGSQTTALSMTPKHDWVNQWQQCVSRRSESRKIPGWFISSCLFPVLDSRTSSQILSHNPWVTEIPSLMLQIGKLSPKMWSDLPKSQLTGDKTGTLGWGGGGIRWTVCYGETLKRVAGESSRVNLQPSLVPTANSHRHLYSLRTPGDTCLPPPKNDEAGSGGQGL